MQKFQSGRYQIKKTYSPIVLWRTCRAFVRSTLGAYIKPLRYQQIFDEIDEVKPKKIMEIGTWNGVRGKQMIERATLFSPNGTIEYTGFDLFENMTNKMYKQEISKIPPSAHQVRTLLEKTRARITLLVGFTQETMKNMDTFNKVDFVFIDGGHDAETVLNDWIGVEKVMHKDTVVIFDDYWHNRDDGPKKIIDSIDRKKYKVSFLPKVDVFFNPDFGRLVISLVKVTLIN